jgi:hypothetical protein
MERKNRETAEQELKATKSPNCCGSLTNTGNRLLERDPAAVIGELPSCFTGSLRGVGSGPCDVIPTPPSFKIF